MRNFTFLEGTARRLCALTLAGAMTVCMSPAYAFADDDSNDDAQQGEASSDNASSDGDSAADQDSDDSNAAAGDKDKDDSSSSDESRGESSSDSDNEEAAEHSIASCSFTMSEYVIWDGKEKKPAVTVKDGDKTLVAGTDYFVAYSNNVKPGVGIVTVKGLGDYVSDDAEKCVKSLQFHIVKFQYRAKTSSLKSYVNLGKTAGSSSSTTSTCLKSLAAKVIKGSSASIDGGISYGVRTAKKAWGNGWASNGSTASSDDLAQALRIKLTGDLAKHFDVYYRVCIRNTGWLDWTKNGSAAGVVGIKSKLRVIGYQIKVLPKGSKAPGATKLSYAVHKDYETFAKYVLDKRIANVSSRTKYMISVDTTLNRMAVYKGKKGSWKRLHYWKCGTGKASTPSYKGDFGLKGTTYRIDSGKISYYYFKRYKKGLGFHSVTTKIYTRTLSRPLSAQLGHNLSHGCIRLTMDNAKWVSQLPRGTHVRIRGLV